MQARAKGSTLVSERRLTMTVTQAAEALGISRGLAYELVARGELPSRPLGGRIVIPIRLLEEFLLGAPASALPEPAEPLPVSSATALPIDAIARTRPTRRRPVATAQLSLVDLLPATLPESRPTPPRTRSQTCETGLETSVPVVGGSGSAL